MKTLLRVVIALLIIIFGAVAVTLIQNMLDVAVTGNYLNVVAYKVLYMAWGAVLFRIGMQRN